ncbi:hypothetical protein F5X99DRAFT_401383 [Biscogniauxia marginata]|nr:hypothetical protein F5X99DRAFT_401383 [Biscogniauxia marginata]
MHLITTCLLTAGVALAHVAQQAPRQPMITPAPVLKERQSWQDAVDGALGVADAAKEHASVVTAEFGKRDGEDWQSVVSSAQSKASSWAETGESIASSAESLASSWADTGASIASSAGSVATSVVDSVTSVAATAADAALSSASEAIKSAESVLSTATGSDQASASSAVASASSAASQASSSAVPTDNAAPGAPGTLSLLPMGAAAAAVLLGAMLL